MTHSADLTIDLNAVASNWSALDSRLADGVDCGAVVKADAYGLGVKPVVSRLVKAGCRSFYLSRLSEAVEVQSVLSDLELELGISVSACKIFVLCGCAPGDEAEFIRRRLVPVLISEEMLVRWQKALTAVDLLNGTLASVLKLDTGMGRLGVEPQYFQRLLSQKSLLQGLGVQMLMSHLACADTPEHPQNELQRATFNSALRSLSHVLPSIKASLANSAGIFLGGDYHFDAVRPGVGLYGGNPQSGVCSELKQAVTLKLPVLQVRDMPKGGSVGYGATHRFDSAARIAIVAGGYADGLLRSLSGRGSCWLHQSEAGNKGWRVPMIGRVSMDSFAIDISHLPLGAVTEGQRVEVIGPNMPLEVVAENAQTVNYEILTSLGVRYDRQYLG